MAAPDDTISVPVDPTKQPGDGTPALGEGGSEAGSVDGGSNAEGADSRTALASTTVAGFIAPNTSAPGQGPVLSAPRPKKFSAVSINKKFFEQNASTPGSSLPSPHPVVVKAGTPTPAKPALQPNSSHSRLVTTKLTAAPLSSTTTGPGWSRPASAVPSSGTSPAPSATPAQPLTTSSASSAPQLPHAGKVIQPQRTASSISSSSATKDAAASGGKSVWGSGRAAASVSTHVQNDFPTAAEVAQGQIAQLADQKEAEKEAAQVEAVHKQALQEQADAFRGVHLNPNAHHWDEMEEDDSNFLDNVIEFGDGKQYKIESTDNLKASQQPTAHVIEGLPVTDTPVSKDERFAEDFDRSWPRSSATSSLPHQRDLPPHAIVPTHTSPQESNRTLFNERSNRLEHVNTNFGPHRPAAPGQAPYLSPRSARSDYTSSPVDHHSHGPPHGIQLLQKPGHSSDPSSRPNPFGSGAPRDRREPVSPHMPPTPSSRDFGRRDSHHVPGRPSPSGWDREPAGDPRGRRLSNMGPPPLPLTSPVDRHKDLERQLPPHLSTLPLSPSLQRVPSREPHLRTSSNLPAVPHEPVTATSPPVAPARPLAVDNPVTALVDVAVVPAVPIADFEEASKAAMQGAAERARLRRQQEEAEREAQKERARKKAAELEARLKPAAAKDASTVDATAKAPVSDAEVVGIIEDAVKIAETPRGASTPLPSAGLGSGLPRPPPLTPMARQSSLQGSARPPGPAIRSPTVRKMSFSTGGPAMVAPSPAAEADSWRSKAKPMSAPPQPPPQVKPVIVALAPKPSMLPATNHLDVQPGEILETFDFSDHGKMVGVEPPPAESTENVKPSSGRPVASDFFEDQSTPRSLESTAEPPGPSTWRRKVPHGLVVDDSKDAATVGSDEATSTSHHHLQHPITDASSSSLESPDPPPVSAMTGPIPPANGMARHPSNPEHARPNQAPLPPSHVAPRSPRASFFREAPMSALDDAILRIKGALDGMHEGIREPTHAAAEEPDVSPVPGKPPMANVPPRPPNKWLPPALRPRSQLSMPLSPLDMFDVTVVEPPRSPEPSMKPLIVRFPKHQAVGPVPARQLQLIRNLPGHVRFDILSWNPPVEGMRRDFSVNDVLFGRRVVIKGKLKVRVSLPGRNRNAGPGRQSSGIDGESGLRVNLPTGTTPPKANGAGAFGRPREADGLSSWRKPYSKSPLGTPRIEEAALDSELHTVSRSPPPEPPTTRQTTSQPSVDEDSSMHNGTSVRSRTQPKMPDGSSVGFYRDPGPGSVKPEARQAVSFTVMSELEESVERKSANPDVHAAAAVLNSSSSNGASRLLASQTPVLTSLVTHTIVKDTASTSLMERKASADVQPNGHLGSSSTGNSSWTKSPLSFPFKDPPPHGPDNELVKAVWSQASDKAGLPVANSLEGIADDLTPLPFTINDVKSEDGETPPPSVPAGPAKMSLHDVTRAFQQVPSSSANGSSAGGNMPPPPSPGGQGYRRPSFGYTQPSPNTSVRPVYPSYPSPMMGSPSPTLMYPPPMASSPGPRPMAMNGHPVHYAQPVWLMGPPGAAPPTPGSAMRALPQYTPQYMPYPSPGGASPMYASSPVGVMPPPPPHPHAHPGAQQQPNGRAHPMAPPPHPHAHTHQHPHPQAHPGALHPPGMPMYAGSPVLMHASAVHAYPSPMTPGRGQQPLRHPGPGSPMAPIAPPHGVPYPPPPQGAYARPAW